MSRFQTIDGWQWPVEDQKCFAAVIKSLADIPVALQYVQGRTLIVQAGGNCGVWAKTLGGIFETVHTFEPDEDNFACLVHNCPAENVIKHHAALGDGGGPIRMDGTRLNCGAYQVAGDGNIPVMTVDGLNLPALDLMYLDIEGYEFKAIMGAEATIAKYRPVIAIENKSLSDRYGKSNRDVEAYIKSLGYQVAKRINRDVIFTPKVNDGQR